MKLLFGTTNPGKLNSMRKTLAPLGIELIGLDDLDGDIPFIAEDGNTPLENARQKSKAYFKCFGIPVFSFDSGLYFIDEPNLIQPGTYVRRYTGIDMDDDQLIEHYSAVAKSNGGTIKAQYINGVSLMMDEDTIYEYQGDEISYNPFFITSKPHCKRVKGIPLNTISIDIKTGKYFYDLENESEDVKKRRKGIQTFFSKHLNITE